MFKNKLSSIPLWEKTLISNISLSFFEKSSPKQLILRLFQHYLLINPLFCFLESFFSSFALRFSFHQLNQFLIIFFNFIKKIYLYNFLNLLSGFLIKHMTLALFFKNNLESTFQFLSYCDILWLKLFIFNIFLISKNFFTLIFFKFKHIFFFYIF